MEMFSISRSLSTKMNFVVDVLEKILPRFYNNNNNVRRIIEHTEVTRNHLTPEICLRLITPNCRLWHSTEECSLFTNPFWGFYWPGGQALARFLLDNRHYVVNKSILDIGSGCGALAIVSKKLDASHAIANDIDPVAITAIEMNASLNDVVVETKVKNLIGQEVSDRDVILFGDMFYDATISHEIYSWLSSLPRGTSILIGDPGRSDSTNLEELNFKKLAEYDLPASCRLENAGYMIGSVWHRVM